MSRSELLSPGEAGNIYARGGLKGWRGGRGVAMM